jgi:oligosaccharide 4-alpha-D-glucosyltransferase
MRRLLVLLLLVIRFTSYAQQNVSSPEVHITSNGKYTIRYYADNIIKLTFTPTGYIKNQNLSDAVILKPRPSVPSLKVKVNGDMVAFNGKSLLINADTMNGYYGFNFALETGEKIFGGGERALPLDRRGYHFNLYNNPWYGYSEGADNLNYSVPFFTSSKGYGLFFDNPSKGFVDIGKQDENVFKAGFSSGELNVYVILGKGYKEVLQSYHKLTGTQPLPPRWAFGNLMSRFGYTSEAQARDILQKMKEEDVPVDAIIFDLFWFGDSIKGTLGNLEWTNKQKWPDPKKMISDFKKEGIHTILVTEPFFVETSKSYAASKPYLAVDSAGKPYYLKDFYFGKGGLIDIFRKDSKDWFWNFYKKQMDIGVEGWWGDLGEPEKHPSDLYHNLKDFGQKRLFNADEVHNAYGHNWTKMLYEKYAQVYPNKRLFSLNRSGFAGSQRYSIFPWTGDVSRSWSGLRAQLPILLGMTMSGVPYVHSDAGGFAGGEGDKELYVRWLQFAAFTPIFRPHGTALFEVEPSAFSFPSEVALIDTPWRKYAKDVVDLRYRFLPYNYTLAYQQTVSGKPLMSPLYYYFPADTTAVKVQDEYMWGENLFVAPILNKGAVSRKYYLPKGKWINIIADSILVKDGGNWYQDSVGLKDVICYAKAGSFIPQDLSLFTYTNTEKIRDPVYLVFHPFSSTPSSGTLYVDDGKSKNALRNGNYKLTTFSSKVLSTKQYEVKIISRGQYQKSSALNLVLMIPMFEGEPKMVLINGKQVKFEWKKQFHTLYVEVPHLQATRVLIRLE